MDKKASVQQRLTKEQKDQPEAKALELMMADLAKSGITDPEAIAELGFVPLSRKQTQSVTKNPKLNVRSYKLPYYDAEGRPLLYWTTPERKEQRAFFRLRFTEMESTLFDGTLVPIEGKYWQPPRSGCQLYIPRLAGYLTRKAQQCWKGAPESDRQFSWKQVSLNTEWELTITEGEKKAVAGCMASTPTDPFPLITIALGGVTSFSDHKNNEALLPDLVAVNLYGRGMNIAFDSDSVSKPQVLAAELALAHELRNAHASVQIIKLPAQTESGKTGLDDFLVAHGLEAYLVLPRHRFAEGNWLDDFNLKWAVIRNPVCYLEQETDVARNLAKFIDLLANQITWKKTEAAGGGTKLKKVPMTEIWRESPLRTEYECMEFLPNAPRVLPPSGKSTYGRINLYRGFAVQPKAGDLTAYHSLMNWLFAGQDEQRNRIEDFIAYKIQHPEVKIPQTIILIGPQGAGKSLLGLVYCKTMAPYSTEIASEQLFSHFNAYAEKKLLILVNELVQPEKKRDAENAIKAMLSNEEIMIDNKYGPKYPLKDYAQYFITSNSHNPLRMADDDRRAYMVEVCQGRTGKAADTPKDIRNQIGAMFLKADAGKDGRAALLDYMLTRDVSHFDPHARAPMTEAKAQAIESERTALEQFAHDLAAEPDQYWARSSSVNEAPIPELCDLADTDQLMQKAKDARKATENSTTKALGNALREAKFPRTKEVRIKHGKKRLWVVRNWEKWRKADPATMAKHWDETHSDAYSLKSVSRPSSRPRISPRMVAHLKALRERLSHVRTCDKGRK